VPCFASQEGAPQAKYTVWTLRMRDKSFLCDVKDEKRGNTDVI
jgi:hypothetical protein